MRLATLFVVAVTTLAIGFAPATTSAAPTIGVYFDREGTQQALTLGSSDLEYLPVEVFVVMHGLEERAAGFEAGLILPEGVQVWNVNPLGDSLDGCGFPPWDFSDMHCYGNCQFSSGPPQLIMSCFMFVPIDSKDLTIKVVPPRTAGGYGGDPTLRVQLCPSSVVEPVLASGPYGDGTAVINPTGKVATDEWSWGRIKSLY